MSIRPMISTLTATALTLGLALPPLALAQEDEVDQIVETGEKRAEEGAAAQEQIDKIANETDDLLQQYKTVMKVVDGLKVYNTLLQRQIDAQEAEMKDLNESIDKVAIIERQIVPLMIRMVEGLDEFIELDVPFLLDERRDRVASLEKLMERADVTSAEKFRNVLEAYQIENEYGRTIETYSESLTIDGQEREVDMFKFGRIALVYQSPSGDLNGAWNQETRQWESLDPVEYRSAIRTAMRVARKQAAPDLLSLPIPAPEAVQ